MWACMSLYTEMYGFLACKNNNKMHFYMMTNDKILNICATN